MIGNYFRKIYEVRSEIDYRFDLCRFLFALNTAIFTVFMIAHITSQSNINTIVATSLMVVGNIVLLVARSLRRERQPLIGHLGIVGLLLMLAAVLMSIATTWSTILGIL
ncbi:MAG: hypothetical protein GFH27_549311n132 [Chloroflexi bacterium AL-W]|nr:hypothetical protein [Chloroflexi bacterium AL-N1]NOK68690.1 hypothetical protein [Chloroflexi bacterium AL-N10]NOK76176.1 hypothetical protein [Chloroflexi bacterium AL-N5]NOK84187.1 hypothetical protein [Chloroflexi bacterium AL-W]NOK91314.1 hypothetical protein [Chloroflexi bacterium AL-N15]